MDFNNHFILGIIALGLIVIIIASGCVQKTKPICGNNVCDGGEFEDFCPRDCKPGEQFTLLKDGRFDVVVPKGYELLGEKHLQDLEYCYELISEFLGITPSYNVIVLKISINSEGRNSGAAGSNTIFYEKSQENIVADLNDVKANNPGGFLYKSSPTYCANTHEFVHVFVGHLSLPGWADEGIAEYAQKNIMAGSKDYFECREDGWYGKDYWGDDKEKLFAFSELDESPDNAEGGEAKWYRTAMCFWEYVDKTYGKESIKQVFQRNDKLIKENRFYKNFVNEVLVPVLGEDVKNTLKQKFGVNVN